MKKLFATMLLLIAATTMNAQTIVKGDMNGDNKLTITDAVSVVDVVLGKSPMQTISAGGSPYVVDNASVVGTWYAPDGNMFSLNEDGTTDYPGAATYKFRPYQGTLMLYGASGRAVRTIVLNEVEPSYLLAIDYATNTYTYYTNSTSLATGITLDQSSLTMGTGDTAQLIPTFTPEGAFASVSWTSSDESVATVDANGLVTAVAMGSCEITATTSFTHQTATCSVTVTQMVESIELSQTIAIFEEQGETVDLTYTVLPADAGNKIVEWSCSNSNVAMVTPKGKVIALNFGTAVVTCEATDGSGVKATCAVYVIDPATYVDLGLPSGTLWATCNIGASNPEDFGDKFAWGETSVKTKYGWDTYKWCNGSDNSLTRYCNNRDYGFNNFTDNLSELELEDDAAYVNWGPAWRMPSKVQFEELINNTTSAWIVQNGVDGVKFTSKKEGNNNFIFLPATEESSDEYEPPYGNYWSRTLSSDLTNYALMLNFDSYNTYGVSFYPRCYGKRVRPVRFK